MRTVPLATGALFPILLLAACAEMTPAESPAASPGTPPAPAQGSVQLKATPIPLPGATGAVSLDYLAVDRAAGKVWVPAGDTASVDVVDVATGKVTRIEGFPTVEREGRNGKRLVGASSVTLAEGVAYIGNRGNSEVCAVDTARLAKGACVALPFPPDGLQYVAATKEVWATTPKDKSIHVIDVATPGKLAVKERIAFEGEPEGYAIDQARGVFYTNLEDANKTLVLDARTRKVTATWEPRCGADGPRGLALDVAKGFLFVACTDRVQVLDAGHGGAQLGTLPAGEGIDNIDYLDERAQLYIAAGKSGTLTLARVDAKGAPAVVATVPTAPGARVVVAAANGTAYVADGKQGRVIALAP